MFQGEQSEIFYQLALSFVPGIGAKTGRALLGHFGSAEATFRAPLKEIKVVEGIGEVRAKGFRDREVLDKAGRELNFVEKNGITVICPGHGYPHRLANCSDAPLVLYYRGNASLDASRVVAVVGTRRNTDYGLKLCEDLIDGLRAYTGVLVVSGLAAGIDAIAHRKSVAASIPTVGVLGHGLDRMYPHTHKQLADQMCGNGGVLSEFTFGANPDRNNFPMRNRIVAGLSDVTVVVESPAEGGALITANMANGYNRDVAAFPGRVTDSRSAGCNDLIRKNVAAMITNADDLAELMNWKDRAAKPVQRQLFINFSPEEQVITGLLQTAESLHADELLLRSGFTSPMLAATLLQLEMQGIVRALPGKHYKMS